MKLVAPLTVLASATGLGVYIPAILMQRGLTDRGVAADVEVIEGYFRPEKQSVFLASRDAQRRNFKLAKIANRMSRDVTDCLDVLAVHQLLETWASQGRYRFSVWSGFWLPLLEEYGRRYGFSLRVDHCHIDAGVSASFKANARTDHQGRDVWLWNWQRKELPHRILVGSMEVEPYGARDHALVMHGGGWALGDYMEKLPELSLTDYALRVIVSERHAAQIQRRPQDRFFALDPRWRAWERGNDGRHSFPPMCEYASPGNWVPVPACGHHAMHGVIRHSKAILSKPGGCTLIDSLASATPVVLLEAYSASEAQNAEIWQHLGYGIAFDDWCATGFSDDVLQRMHENLLGAGSQGIDYIRALSEEITPSGVFE